MIPSENPRLFCRAALLPRLRHGPGAPHMPVPGQRSHLGRLSERPNAHRNLIFIEPIDDLTTDVHNFHAALPAQNPTIQPNQIQNPFTNLLNTPSDSIICVASAVRRTILAASELVLSNLQHRWVSSRNYAHLAKGVATMLWSTSSTPRTEISESLTNSSSSSTLCDPDVPKAAVATFVQEPWVLSPHDFNAFCSLRELRNYVPKFTANTPSMPHDRPWGQAQQLWAFIHDRCEEHQCHFFIVTSYDQWAFGCFSKEWTRAFITPPYSYNDARPTIMERTLHWVLSATLQSEHQSNGYVTPEELPWMSSLYVVPEIIGEHSWAVSKPPKRRLPETEEDFPTPSPIARSPNSAGRLKSSPITPLAAPEVRLSDSPQLPEIPIPPIARPTTLVAGVDAWRQRIPPRNKTRKTRSKNDQAREVLPLSPGPPPHASPFRRTGHPFTPPQQIPGINDSPGRLRLPPLLQSPARPGSTRSERSGDTALDQTDALSMEVVAADVQPPRDIVVPSRPPRSVDQDNSRPMQISQPLPPASISRGSAPPHTATAPAFHLPPRGITSASQPPLKSSVPRRTTRLINKRLREHHLAGTISTLTEESWKG